MLLEEKKQIGDREYWLGHTADYVKVAVPENGEGLESNRFLSVHVKDFLQDEILLAQI